MSIKIAAVNSDVLSLQMIKDIRDFAKKTQVPPPVVFFKDDIKMKIVPMNSYSADSMEYLKYECPRQGRRSWREYAKRKKAICV